MIQDDYKRYKNSGDICMLNPDIRIYDVGWEIIEEEQ
jgi:hypothetical protein